MKRKWKTLCCYRKWIFEEKIQKEKKWRTKDKRLSDGYKN